MKISVNWYINPKKTRPVHKELGEGERDVCCDKKGLSSTSLSPLAEPVENSDKLKFPITPQESYPRI